MSEQTNVVKIEPAAVPAQQQTASETAAILSIIERLAINPNADIDKLERIVLMRERMIATAAKASYLRALSDMQPHMPVIEKKGTIERGKHKTTGELQKGSPYAKFEDVVEGIRPVLAAHGFSLSFRVDMTSEPGRLKTTAILGHRDGHSEETTISLPIDDSGGKNNVQGWGSSASYGKRYTSFALLNIVARGEDDDGKAAGAPAVVTDEQAARLREWIEATNSEEAAFLRYFKADSIATFPADRFDDAVAGFKKKAGRK